SRIAWPSRKCSILFRSPAASRFSRIRIAWPSSSSTNGMVVACWVIAGSAAGLDRGQGNKESGAFAGAALNPHTPLLSLEHTLGNGQTQDLALAGVRIQAVEDVEHLCLVLRGDADAVVGHGVD